MADISSASALVSEASSPLAEGLTAAAATLSQLTGALFAAYANLLQTFVLVGWQAAKGGLD